MTEILQFILDYRVITFIFAAFSLTGVILNIYKDKRCFIIWAFTNFFWMAHNLFLAEFAQAILFGTYLVLSIVGWIKWKKQGKENV